LLIAVSAAADEPGPGAAELQKCKICHMLDNSGGGSHVGPNLHGVFGRQAGTAPDYVFSESMKASGIVWDDETLAKFLRDPRTVLPATKMTFPGIKDEATMNDLLQRLKQATQ
jgi:cytochrome c